MDDALKQLRDLHMPQPPGVWPLAPGWWLLAAVAAVLAVLLARYLYRARQRMRPFRLADGALDRLLAAAHERRLDAREYADGVNALLKRALIHGARRHDAAPLTGSAWLEYLDRIGGGDAFSNGAGAALGDGRFAPDFQWDPAGLHLAARVVLRAVAKQARR